VLLLGKRRLGLGGGESLAGNFDLLFTRPVNELLVLCRQFLVVLLGLDNLFGAKSFE
jgi:hypothetical protein